jgi:hypothetical protein
MPEISNPRAATQPQADVRPQVESPQGPPQPGRPIGEMRRVTKAVGDSHKQAEAAFKSK